MKSKHDVLILGASYGSLLAVKLMLAGNTVKLVCLPAEAELINRECFASGCLSRVARDSSKSIRGTWPGTRRRADRASIPRSTT